MTEIEEPETFGDAAIDKDGAGHSNYVFPVGFSESILRLANTRGRLEPDASLQEELSSGTCYKFGIEVTLNSAWDAAGLHEESEKGIMNVSTCNPFETINVFLSRFVVDN
jgi:hypothetical protein